MPRIKDGAGKRSNVLRRTSHLGSGSSGAKRARMYVKPEAAGSRGSPGASDTVMTGPVVKTIMAIMGTANTMGNTATALVVKMWERPQVWDNFLPEKTEFVQGMIDLCGAEYSDIRSAGAQYDIIQLAETERVIDQERREKHLRNQQLKALAAEMIKESNQVGAGAKKSVKSGANEATDASSVSGKATVEMPPPKVTFETASAVTVQEATTSKSKPKYRGAPLTTYTKIAPAPGIAKVKDGAELFMECIYNAMEINIPATGAVDILGSLCNESNDGSFTKRKEGGTMTLPSNYAGQVCKSIGVISTTTSDAETPTYDIPDYGHIIKTSAIYNRLTETHLKPRGDVELKFVSETKAKELKRDYEAEQKTLRERQLAEMLKNLDSQPKVVPVKHAEILLDRLIPENEPSVEPTTPALSLASSVGQQDVFHGWTTSEVDQESSRPASSVAIPSPSTPSSQIIEQLGFHLRRLGDNTPRIPKISPPTQEDEEVMIIKEVTADVPPRAARFIKEESHEDGEIIFTGTEPAILLPHLGDNDLLLPNDNPSPSQDGRSQGLNVYQAANNKMDFHSLVWDDWANANNVQLLRMGILMSSKHDAVRPSIWTLTERGVPSYQECAEGFVRVPFISYAHNVAPTLLDTSEHLFAHRLWFCHYVKPPLVFRSDNTAPEEVVHCTAMIMDFMSKAYTVPWVKSLNKFLSELRNLERRCKLAMETLFRSRGGCNKEDYILFVGWINYTLVSIMEEQMVQCRLPCSEIDPQIAYPTRQDHIAKLALNHINACVLGERFTMLEKKRERGS